MKKAVFGTIIIAAAGLPTAARAETVAVVLSGVKSAKGDLYVSLQTREQFMQPTGSNGKIVRRPRAGVQTVTLTGVEPGDYSVAVWHDVNGNKRFDKAADGTPLDGWAMVNADKIRAAPTFDQVSIPVKGAPRTVKLEMRYGR